MDSFCLQWLPYAFAKGVVDVVNPFTVPGRKREVNGEAILSETLPKARVVRLSTQYFYRRDAEVAVSHHCVEVLSPGAISPGEPDSPDYYVDADGEAD